MIHSDEIYSVSQLAKILKIRPRTLYAMVRNRQIPYFKAIESGSIRFAGWQIKSWIDKREKSCSQKP